MPSAKRREPAGTAKRPAKDIAPDECEALLDHDKSKVECLCPKCGKKHVMNFHWIGRGIPRKYCQSCRDSI